jgi:hypothetical protein
MNGILQCFHLFQILKEPFTSYWCKCASFFLSYTTNIFSTLSFNVSKVKSHFLWFYIFKTLKSIMKKKLILLLFLFCSFNSFSQDTLQEIKVQNDRKSLKNHIARQIRLLSQAKNCSKLLVVIWQKVSKQSFNWCQFFGRIDGKRTNKKC